LLNVDAIEVENRLLPDELVSLGKPVIKKISLTEYSEAQLLTEVEAYHSVADAFHLYGGETLNTSVLKDLCARYQIIWGFPVEVASVVDTLQTFNPFALNLSGGLEEKAGIKDFDEMNELFELIYQED
jgi:phosphoribosylanthranilate isomerase